MEPEHKKKMFKKSADSAGKRTSATDDAVYAAAAAAASAASAAESAAASAAEAKAVAAAAAASAAEAKAAAAAAAASAAKVKAAASESGSIFTDTGNCEKARESAKKYQLHFTLAYAETSNILEDLGRAYIDVALSDLRRFREQLLDAQKTLLLKLLTNAEILLMLASPTRFQDATHGSKLICEPGSPEQRKVLKHIRILRSGSFPNDANTDSVNTWGFTDAESLMVNEIIQDMRTLFKQHLCANHQHTPPTTC